MVDNKINTIDKEKLKLFIHLLQKVQKPLNKTFDLGLIVKEPESEISSNRIFEEIKQIVAIEKITYDESSFDEEIIEKIINAFEKGRWIFLEIKKDIGSLLLNQLKHLVNYNALQLIDYRGKEVFEMKMPEDARVIVFAERDFIENKISYPHFYILFGPTLSI